MNQEYVINQRSAIEIAEEMGCKENNILYWLKKHDIPRRSMSEIRATKHWGSSGKDNPMYGINGADHPGWKGGVTPERQALYSSEDWKLAARTVRKRDKHTCQRCGWKEGGGIAGHVHHIVPFADDVELRTSSDNLILLCPECHAWVHSLDNIEKELLSC